MKSLRSIDPQLRPPPTMPLPERRRGDATELAAGDTVSKRHPLEGVTAKLGAKNASVLEMSLTGFSAETDKHLRPGESYPVTLVGAVQVAATATVVWCRLVGTEPLMAVNLGTGTPETAAALVEYCNLEKGTRWADLRRRSQNAFTPNI